MKRRVSHSLYAVVVLGSFCTLAVQANSAPSAHDIKLDGTDWRMGSFEMGAGERAGAANVDFNDAGFSSVTVPGNTQLQAGFTGAARFLESKELIEVNKKEWWYRKSFRADSREAGIASRIIFDGSDYFTTVWLNGQLVGSHEGTYTSFSLDVTSVLHYGGDNVLAVRVTHPWIPPDGRALAEYINGDFAGPDIQFNAMLVKSPYYISVNWDALPAEGNATFAMGIWRSVHLRTSGVITISDLRAETRSIEPDGSAVLRIAATLDNASDSAQIREVQLLVRPDNFAGPSQAIPTLKLKALPGETTAEAEVRIPHAELWWSWDTGRQNLYDLEAGIAPQDGLLGDEREVRFGIRTITRGPDMAYTLNGRRLFIKGSWFPIADFYPSTPTKESYERDLRLARNANLNMLVNFTVVEKPEFYDLCDQLGFLVVEEMPFPQTGPAQVLDKDNPRREPFLQQARLQISQIVRMQRNHPSVIEWAPLAEAHEKKAGRWAIGSVVFDQEGYETFIAQMKSIVAELAPDTIFHPSLCDLGEEHFWTAAAGDRTQRGSYQDLFNASTGFVSEYGSVSMSSYENLGRFLSPEQQWDPSVPDSLRLLGLPIRSNAYAYWTSTTNDGLYSMLYRTEHYIDRRPRSLRELVSDTQLYQAFILKYAAEAFRRKKYEPVMGIRFWDFLELEPGFHFAIVDYDRVPKTAYWYMKRAQAPVAISFAFKDALDSQIAGRQWSAPVWVINDTDRSISGAVHAELLSIEGKPVASQDFPAVVAPDSKAAVGAFSLVLPGLPGVYVLRASLKSSDGIDPVTETSFIKVVPSAFGGSHRVLLIAETRYATPIARMLGSLGLDVDKYDQNSLQAMASDLHDGAAIHAKYDAIWLGSFEALSKVMPSASDLALEEAVRLGTGFIVTGGDGSFHGGQSHAAVMEGTAISSAFPVKIAGQDDLMLGGYSMDDTLGDRSLIHEIAAVGIDSKEDPAIRESRELLQRYGIPGFNQVSARPGTRTELLIAGEPLLVTGTYGAGKVAAFTGLTPSEDESSPSSLDELLIAKPANRGYFTTFANLLKYVLPGDAQLATGLLALHEMPLFETLKELPRTDLAVRMAAEPKDEGQKRSRKVLITNRGGYAHLVHLRVGWGATEPGPLPTEFTDNDFELLPKESREILVQWESDSQNKLPHGELIIDASNAQEKRLTL